MITGIEQVKLIILYILLGMFIAITFDTFICIIRNDKTKTKLIISYILELIYWVLIIYISSLYIIKNTSLYISLYGIFFFVLGTFIYYSFLHKSFSTTLYNYKHNGKKILIIIFPLLFPIELIGFIIRRGMKIFRIKRNK